MPKRSGLFLFATIRPKAAHFDQARRALEDLIPQTLAEPECHLFSVFESETEGGILHLFEHFSDQAALDAHYAQPYTQAVFAHYQNWLLAPVEGVQLSAISDRTIAQFSRPRSLNS